MSDPARVPIYAAADLFVERALRRDDSLFTPGRSIWSLPNLEDLRDRFIGKPDTSKDTFDEKFQRQLAGASDEVIQLSAEIVFVYWLAAHQVKANTKRESVERILSWGKNPVSVPDDLAGAFGTGLASTGFAFLTQKNRQVAFLVEFGIRWKRAAEEERGTWLADPWAFKTQVFSAAQPGAQAEQHALLHLVFPETFEDIISQSQKKRIAECFADQVVEPSDDVDRRILAIRSALTPTYGTGFAFYDKPLVDQWNPEPEFWTVCEKLLAAYPQRPPKLTASTEPFKLAKRLRELSLEHAGELAPSEHWESAASVGVGKWAEVPWCAIFDNRETTTAQKGTYPVVHFLTEPQAVIRLGWGVSDTEFKGRADERAAEVASQLLDDERAQLTGRGFALASDGDATASSGSEEDQYRRGMVCAKVIPAAEIAAQQANLNLDLQVLLTSYSAWTERQHSPTPKPVAKSRRYWVFAPGAGASLWEEFYDQKIIAIGWDGTPDLRQYKTKRDIQLALQALSPDSKTQKSNDALACWQFTHEIEKNDLVFVKKGTGRVLGCGVVEGDYAFDETRKHFRHVRRVRWLAKGSWSVPKDSRMAVKTLTDITPYPDFVKLLAEKTGVDPNLGTGSVTPGPVSYWWLNANPNVWDFESAKVGERQTYTSLNERGNKRQKYKYFQEVKPGDLMVGYVTSPVKEIGGICRITSGLHESDEGEAIEFEKIESLDVPVPYATLEANPDLANCEPIASHQGSLFKLTEQEYEIIRSLIDELAIPVKTEIESYDKQKAMQGLFLAEAQFDEMLAALNEKKNVVLQGAPGVGKTYVAKRLAYALIGSNDPQRVEMIQYHQSYSYEDFIQGFRPNPKGHFDLRYGIFHQFCRRAQRDEADGKPYVFIIDEINRGNLSKIFGELMMLIEPDKRGKQHAIPLTYSQDADERFYIPENLHLIGMMNTADRSLAMVDYALRRRFRFITLRPEFSSEAFQSYLTELGATPELVKKVVCRMNALNEAITADTKNLGPGYQIGHSYFCPRVGIAPDNDWYRRVIESEIVPLIREYWFDNEPKVKDQRTALLA